MTPRSIYVAASSKERDLAAAYMGALQAAGWRIAFDWVAAMNASPVPDHQLPVEEQKRHALADLRAISEAQVMWLLGPTTPSVGAYVELGYALRGPGRVVVSGPQSLFTSLAHERYATHAEAFAALTRDARGVERLAGR